MAEADTGRMRQAVSDSLDALELRPEHAAIGALASELAGLLDEAAAAGRALEAYRHLSPRLAGVLRELGATPASSSRRGGDDDDPDSNDPAERELDDLERQRRTRADRASAMDATTPGPDA